MPSVHRPNVAAILFRAAAFAALILARAKQPVRRLFWRKARAAPGAVGQGPQGESLARSDVAMNVKVMAAGNNLFTGWGKHVGGVQCVLAPCSSSGLRDSFCRMRAPLMPTSSELRSCARVR